MIPISKNLRLFAFLLVLCINASLLFYACEVVDDDGPIQETFTDIDDFYASREVKSEVYKIDAIEGGSFTTEKGSVLEIPKNAFTSKRGLPVSGTIDIELKEVFSTLDIINSGVFPISTGAQVLNSGGEFYISAESGGQELVVARDAFINLEIPAQAFDPNMQLFFGGPDNDSDVNWQPLDTVGVIDTIGGDTNRVFRSNSSFRFNSADNTYKIDLDSMGWGNIDAFMSVQYFDCTFNLVGLDGLDEGNTTAFAVFKDQNTVWPMGVRGWGSISNNQIQDNHLADVDMNVVVISVVKKKLYYGLLEIKPEPNTVYDIEMKSIESKALDNIISTLP